jgi:hypothetical protein
MPLSTIFELYRGGQFYWWRKPDKTITLVDIDKITDLLMSASFLDLHLEIDSEGR